MSPPPFAAWLTAFVWTLALELPVYVLLLRRRFASWWAPCVVALVANAATHPALWYLLPRFDPWAAWVVVAETAVTAVEAVIVAAALRLRPTPARALATAGLTSLAANALSTTVGLLCFR